MADYMFASLTDSTPPGSAFTSEPNPPGIASSSLLCAEGNIEGVLRAVLRAKQEAKQEVGAPILPLHCASEQPDMGYMGHFSHLSHGKKITDKLNMAGITHRTHFMVACRF